VDWLTSCAVRRVAVREGDDGAVGACLGTALPIRFRTALHRSTLARISAFEQGWSSSATDVLVAQSGPNSSSR
jgi:hypothetical protein